MEARELDQSMRGCNLRVLRARIVTDDGTAWHSQSMKGPC